MLKTRSDPYAEPIPPIPPETLAEFSLRYIALYETVTGDRFAPPPPEPPAHVRIRDNVASYLAEARDAGENCCRIEPRST